MNIYRLKMNQMKGCQWQKSALHSILPAQGSVPNTKTEKGKQLFFWGGVQKAVGHDLSTI